MKHMKLLMNICLVVLIIFAGTACWGDGNGPTQQLKPTLEEVLQILDDPALQGDEKKEDRRRSIMTSISAGFDFREMSRRVLGKTWNDITNEQKDYFVVQVTKLLENVYIGKLEDYGGSEVEFVAERIKGKRAQVTTLISYEQSKIPIHYIMQKEQEAWMVYDINIEGVSLVRNYMEQFRTILQESNYNGLIKVIEEKNKSFAEGNGNN